MTIKKNKDGYAHKCPFCGHKWIGRKRNPLECTKCKRRLDHTHKNPPGRNAFINYLTANLIKKGVRPKEAYSEAKKRTNGLLKR